MYSGLVITLASPVHIEKELLGVVAVDVSVNDVLARVAYFANGEHQYAFIIDELGMLSLRNETCTVPAEFPPDACHILFAFSFCAVFESPDEFA